MNREKIDGIVTAALRELSTIQPAPVAHVPTGRGLSVEHEGATAIDNRKIAGVVAAGPASPITMATTGSIPTTMAELPELQSRAYDLTVRAATELSIPVIGTIGGGLERRVIVYEWSRSAKVVGDDGVQRLYGWAIRLCLTINKWNAQAAIALPVLAAQAQMGAISASWVMQVRGLAGMKIDSVVLPPEDLNVETFVLARQSLNEAIRAAYDPATVFVPGIVLSEIHPNTPESEYWLAAVRTYALSCIRRSRTMEEALERLDNIDAAAIDIITEVYNRLGIAGADEEPSNAANDAASDILRGIDADT